MQAIEFVDSALEIIMKGKKSTRKRYQGEKEWLEERKRIWTHSKIRIGVLGVTSCGKSTLINAIIGMELLSTEVKPSTSQLVSCHKGNKPQAIISFKTARDLVLEGKKLCLKEIKQYSDEGENRDNIKGVTGISITTPSFDFGDYVVLIDSAGLDAYNLESHEKLTLEILLPTIDMCVFVTTLKTNSDKKTKTVLDAVAKHNCPLVIVQNMLDSVEASADGKKSKDIVALEHKNRLQKIIDASNVKGKVDIVQLSAIYAVQERCRPNEKLIGKSYYHEFKAKIDKDVEALIPNIDKVRCESIAGKYEDLIKEEEKVLEGKSLEKPVFKYEGLKVNVKENLEDIVREVNSVLSGLKDEYNSHKEISVSSEKRRVAGIEEAVLLSIEKANRAISDTAGRLNIPSRDLTVRWELKKIDVPQEITRTKTETELVKKEGFFKGGVARFFGTLFGQDEWGYEKKVKYVTVVDNERTLEEIKRYRQRVFNAHSKTVSEWQNSLGIVLGNIYSHIEKEEVAFKARQEEIEDVLDVKSTIDALKTLIKSMGFSKKVPRTQNSAASEKKEKPMGPAKDTLASLEKMKISKYQRGLYDISKNILHSISRKTLEKCCLITQAPAQRVVLGWDFDSMRNFSIRFMDISLEEQDLEDGKQVRVKNTTFVLHPSDTEIRKIKEARHSVSFFIMVNAQQDGSARNEISKLALKKHLEASDKIFFVVQNFDSLINSGAQAIYEMKANIQEYYKEFEMTQQKGLSIISHSNPLYNLAFVQGQLEPQNSVQRTEIELLERLRKNYEFLWDAKTSVNVGHLIRNQLMEARN